MKKILLSISALVLAGSAQAATINWANGTGRGHAFVLGDGVTRVPTGSLVRVGFLSTANDASSFVEFGTTTMGDPGGGVVGGHIPGAGKSITTDTTNFANRQLYIWVYNAATAAAATQSELFTSTAWLTPADFNTPVATFNITLGQTAAPTVPVSRLSAAADTDAGQYRIGSITIGAGTNDFASIYQLGTIPEPSTSLMASLVAFGLLARRRR